MDSLCVRIDIVWSTVLGGHLRDPASKRIRQRIDIHRSNRSRSEDGYWLFFQPAGEQAILYMSDRLLNAEHCPDSLSMLCAG